MTYSKLILAFWFFISTSLSAFATDVRKIDPEFAAKSAASFLNSHKTPNDLLNSLTGFYTVGEIADCKSLLIKAGYKLNEKIPAAKVKGNSVTLGGSKMTFDANRTLSLNSTVYRPLGKPLEVFLKQVLDHESAGSAAHLSLFSVAHAASPLLVGILALTGVAVVGGAYARAAGRETLLNNSITCKGDDFVVRKKKSNALGYSTHENIDVDAKLVSELLEKDIVKCDDGIIEELKQAVAPMTREKLKSRAAGSKTGQE